MYLPCVCIAPVHTCALAFAFAIYRTSHVYLCSLNRVRSTESATSTFPIKHFVCTQNFARALFSISFGTIRGEEGGGKQGVLWEMWMCRIEKWNCATLQERLNLIGELRVTITKQQIVTNKIRQNRLGLARRYLSHYLTFVRSFIHSFIHPFVRSFVISDTSTCDYVPSTYLLDACDG